MRVTRTTLGMLLLLALAAVIALTLVDRSSSTTPIRSSRTRADPQGVLTGKPELQGTKALVDARGGPAKESEEEGGDPTCTIRGRVLQFDNRKPLTGVSVYALGSRRALHLTSALARSTSDENGVYVLKDVPAERWRGETFVFASGAGWISQEISTSWSKIGRHFFDALLVAETIPNETFELDLLVVQCARIKGRVLSPEGVPLPQATVRGVKRVIEPLLSASRRSSAMDFTTPVTTDAMGRYVLYVPAGCEAFVVEARAEGYCWAESTPVITAVGAAAKSDIHLASSRTLTLTLVNTDDGSPIQDAVVLVKSQGKSSFSNNNNIAQITSANGIVEITPIPTTPVRVHVFHHEFTEFRTRYGDDACGDVFSSNATGGAHYEGIVRLEPLVEVKGRLSLPAGEAVNVGPFHVVVEALDAPGYERFDRYREVDPTTQSFTLFVPRTGTFAVEASDPLYGDGGYGGKAVVTAQSKTVRIEIRALPTTRESDEDEPIREPDAWWTIQVVGPQGHPVRSVSMSALLLGNDDSSEDDPFDNDLYDFEEENWHARHEAPHRARVPLSTSGKGIAIGLDNIVLADGRKGAGGTFTPFSSVGGEATLQVYAATTISGVVQDKHGDRVQGHTVVATTLGDGVSVKNDRRFISDTASALTNSRGEFHLRDVAPGKHRLWLRPLPGTVPAPPIVAKGGSTRILLKTRPAVSANIQVVNDGNLPVANATVIAKIIETYDGYSGSSRDVEGRTDNSGLCVLRGLDSDARYELLAEVSYARRDHESTSIKRWAPNDTRLILARLYSIEVQVQMENGTAAQDVRVRLTSDTARNHSSRSNKRGRVNFLGLKPGPYSLHAVNSQQIETKDESESSAIRVTVPSNDEVIELIVR